MDASRLVSSAQDPRAGKDRGRARERGRARGSASDAGGSRVSTRPRRRRSAPSQRRDVEWDARSSLACESQRPESRSKTRAGCWRSAGRKGPRVRGPPEDRLWRIRTTQRHADRIPRFPCSRIPPRARPWRVPRTPSHRASRAPTPHSTIPSRPGRSATSARSAERGTEGGTASDFSRARAVHPSRFSSRVSDFASASPRVRARRRTAHARRRRHDGPRGLSLRVPLPRLPTPWTPRTRTRTRPRR